VGKLNTLDPATIKAFETYLGLNVDGQWDSDLERSVGRYQTMLGQTPGQTDTADQYAALVEALQKRAAAFGPGADTTPMQDAGFQAFLRESGARESDINALYRRRVDEELDARNRIAKTNAEGTYRYVG
jgi:hypothetical protein